MSTPTIGFGPLKGPERLSAAAVDPDKPKEIIDPGTGRPTTKPVPDDITLTIPFLTLTTDTYEDGALMALRASIRAVWGEPTQGESDTDPRGIGGYELQFTTGDAPGWSPDLKAKARDVTIRSMPVEREVTIRVRAVTNAGVRGPWKGATILTKKDNDPPPVPSKPTVTGTFKGGAVRWDGEYAGGEPVPPDWRYTLAQISLDKTFPPSATLIAGYMYEAGATATVALGTSPFTFYARLIGVDFSGNMSQPSEVAEGKSLQLLPPDIGDKAITERTLAEGAVAAAAIAENAVTAFGLAPGVVGEVHLGNLAVTAEKIVDGAISKIKLAAGAVDETKIVDGAILEEKLAPLAVTASRLANSAVVRGKIGENAVDNLALASGSVAQTQMQDNAITSRVLADFAVRARSVGFDVAGANQLLNSSFEDRADPASPAPDTVIPHWEAEQYLTMRRVTDTGFHGTMALETTFNKSVAASAPLQNL